MKDSNPRFEPLLSSDFGKNALQHVLNTPGVMQLIFDVLPLQVAVKSMRPETRGQFLFWNRHAEEWSGISQREILGRTDHDFFPREQADFFAAKDLEVIEKRRTIQIEEEPITSPGKTKRLLRTIKVPVYDEQGNPLAVMVISENITQIKQTAEELDKTVVRLRDERNLFSALLDNLPMCAFATNARPDSKGEFLLWNRTMEMLHGRSADEVLNHTPTEVYESRTARAHESQNRQVIQQREPLYIPLETLSSPENGRRMLRTIKAPVFDDDGQPIAVVGVAEDITERIQMEAERSQAVEMIRHLNSRVPGAIYQLQSLPNGDHTFTYMSERVAEIYGRPAADFLQDYMVAWDCVFPDDMPTVAQAQLRAREEGVPFKCEFRIRRPDGSVRWVHSTATSEQRDDAVYWHGFIMDVTERRAADEALRESEERWELALAGTEAGVWDWNIRSGQLFYSQRWLDMFGYTKEEAPQTPRDLLELIHPEDRDEVRRATLRHLRRRNDLFRAEYRLRRRDGQHVWIIAHAKAHFDEHGPTRMIGTFIDISERKRVEEQLLQAKLAAERANRAKSDFLAMMSHEIRTPLNGVIGFAELLTETELDPRQHEYVQTVCESGANLLHVLDDILDYSKIESGKLAMEISPFSTRELVHSATEVFRAKADAKGLTLRVEIDAEVPGEFRGDPMRMRQILTNLISNAVKFTSRGGVRIRIERGAAATPAGIFPLRVIVSDTGPGIAEEDIPLLFTPFQQLDVAMTRRFGGTGLGLAIVRRLLDLMDGHVTVTASSEGGASFAVEIPLPIADSVPVKRRTDATALPKVGVEYPLSILLVEDNVVNRRLARLMLEKLGYAPDEAIDGPHAIRCATGKSYDLILMDIQMPGMDGYEAARRIRELSEGGQTLIAALTAHAMHSDRERSKANGMFRHVCKPLRLDDLRRLVISAAEFRTNRDRPDFAADKA